SPPACSEKLAAIILAPLRASPADELFSEVVGMVVASGRGDGWVGGGGWRSRCVIRFGLGAEAGDGLPVVLAWLIREPLRQRHEEEAAESFGVGLVESAHLAESL